MTSEYRRLPQDVKPTEYTLALSALDLSGTNNWTYQGHVSISLHVQNSTTRIVLNAHKLRNISARITTSSKATVTQITQDEDTQRLILHLDKPIDPSTPDAHLELTYEATINGDLTSFYRSQEKPGYIFTTQFQPSDARRAFPCFDEPDFKATFELSVEVPEELTVISNMPETSSLPSGDGLDRKVVSFERSPVMSTYLLAWGIGELKYIEKFVTRRYGDVRLPIRVYTSPSIVRYGEFALDLAEQVIDYFAKTFGIDYPLPKLDLLAVTEMSDDAMENWGLVIFRSTALLLDEARTDPGVRTRVAYIIAHELAHQWFGNLVTMTWWDELWLNEGFATWAGWDACNFLFPEWDVWGQFVAESMQEAFELDSLPSSHPVEVPVLDGLEVDSIFDSISYLKGASIVRMLIAYLGRNAFLRGLSHYLKTHMYQNATAENLWSAFERVSSMDVTRMIQPWIKTMGFPVISVEEAEPGKYILHQSSSISTSESESSWFIPILVQTAQGVVQHCLATPSNQLRIESGLIKINTDHRGFYRTNLSDEMLMRMSSSWMLEDLSRRDQAGLLGDAMAMAYYGRGISTSTVLSFIDNFDMEADFVVWTSILSCVRQIRLIFSGDTTVDEGLKKFTRRLIESKDEPLGWSPETHESYSTQRLRPLLLTTAGLVGDKEIVNKACKLFEAIQSGSEKDIQPFLRHTVFDIAVSEKGNEAVLFLKELYQKVPSPHEREAIARAMGQLTNPHEAHQCLCSNFSDSMTAQDLRTLAIAMANNSAIPGVVWKFIREEWNLVSDRLAGSMAIFEPFIRGCLQPLTSLSDAEEVEAFFAEKDTLGYQRGLVVATESIKANAAYKDRDIDVVRDWLRTYG